MTLEETGANTETDKQFIYNTYTALLKDVEPLPNMTKTETYEEQAKELFKDQPANMKLLVVVDQAENRGEVLDASWTNCSVVSFARVQRHHRKCGSRMRYEVEVVALTQRAREPATRLALIGLEPLHTWANRLVVYREIRLT